MRTFPLSDAQVVVIRDLNSKYLAIQDIVSNWKADGPEATFDLILGKLGQAKYAYDEWFTQMETTLKVNTTPTQKWNVDFAKKELQLID